jgi:hypothetical protein
MAMTMSAVAAYWRTGVVPIVLRIPATAFTLSSPVGVAGSPVDIPNGGQPAAQRRRAPTDSSARKAHSDSAVAGSALNPRGRHRKFANRSVSILRGLGLAGAGEVGGEL